MQDHEPQERSARGVRMVLRQVARMKPADVVRWVSGVRPEVLREELRTALADPRARTRMAAASAHLALARAALAVECGELDEILEGLPPLPEEPEPPAPRNRRRAAEWRARKRAGMA